MTLTIPKTTSRITFVVFGYSLLILIWLSLEDNSALSVALLGTGAAILIVLLSIWQRIGGRVLHMRVWFTGMLIVGAMIGGLSVMMTTLFMFFKSGWHGHIYPDYPLPMMLAMLSRLPVWTFAGLLIGLSVAMMSLAIIKPQDISTTTAHQD